MAFCGMVRKRHALGGEELQQGGGARVDSTYHEFKTAWSLEAKDEPRAKHESRRVRAKYADSNPQ